MISGGRLVTFFLPRRRAMGVLIAAGLSVSLLTGCNDGDEQVPEESPSVSAETSSAGLRGGTFNARLPSGASVRITLPATPPPDEDVDKLRKDAGVERALYAKISIDNRNGRQPVSVSRLVLTAEDGSIYRLDALPKVAPEWTSERGDNGEWTNAGGDRVSEEKARDIDRRVDDTVAKYTGDVPVGGRGDEILVGDLSRLPATFASMELIPSMGDSEERAVRPSPDSRNEPAAPRPASPADPAEPEAPEEDPPPGDPGDEPTEEEPPADGGGSESTTDPVPEEPTDAPAPPQEPVPSEPGTQPTTAPEAGASVPPVALSVPAQAVGEQQPVQP